MANESLGKPIYLDYNASTPIDSAVAEVMRPLLATAYGNPSSGHWAGAPARAVLDQARLSVATLLGCTPSEIVFTSGGSEANNLALKGMYFRRADRSPHLITSRTEHPAILAPCRFLERLGATVTYLPVDGHGLVDPDDVRRAVTHETILISVMHANNETGTVQPIAEIGKIAAAHGIPLHTDAAQSVGKITTKVDELGVDLLSVAGHKMYAPKGIGALFVRRGLAVEPLIHGAGHEGGRRAGTESAMLAAALGKACELARIGPEIEPIRTLRDAFWSRLRSAFGDRVVLNGHPERRLPNTLNVSFRGERGADLLSKMPDVAASTGSACHTGAASVSPVLEAMRVDREIAAGAIRFSLGRGTTREEIEAVVEHLRRLIS